VVHACGVHASWIRYRVSRALSLAST
jgi:hypothetical protein